MSDAEGAVEIEPEDAEDQEVLLADPDDYHRAQRLRTIHERRRRVHKVMDEIDRYTSTGQHNNQKRALADAVVAYIAEVETVLRDADIEVELPEKYPFESPDHFATNLGAYTDEHGERQISSYNTSIFMFRQVSNAFSEVKPLIEPDDSNEWDV